MLPKLSKKIVPALTFFAQVAMEMYTTPEEELRQREEERRKKTQAILNVDNSGRNTAPPEEKLTLNDHLSILR